MYSYSRLAHCIQLTIDGLDQFDTIFANTSSARTEILLQVCVRVCGGTIHSAS